ncbi:MAG: hypothetical protein QM503_06215 [Bacteroidota bacterium]
MNKVNLTIVLTMLFFMSACVDKEKNKLDNRVIDFWHHKINKNFDKAYDFLSPGWKSNESKDSYQVRLKQSQIKWLSSKIKEKTCSETYLCTVTLDIEYEFIFKGTMTGSKIVVPSQVTEKWLMKDNIWYFVPSEQAKIKKL